MYVCVFYYFHFFFILDACQYGYIPYVVREAVGDRHNSIHESNLFDLQAKYAEVSTKTNVIEELKKLYLGTSLKTKNDSSEDQEEKLIDESTFQIEEVTITKILKADESGPGETSRADTLKAD